MKRSVRYLPIALILIAMLMDGCSALQTQSARNVVWSGEDLLSRNYFGEESHFIIYLHGKIIEDEGINAVHPEYGKYEYLETLSYLGNSGGRVVSEVRPTNTDGVEYAERVAGWVNHLISSGVPADSITVIGFSKGAGITIYVSDLLEDSDLNFALIGICGDWINSNDAIQLSGRILSLFETSDEYGDTCQALVDRSPGVTDFEEIAFTTGEGHGAFYQADSFWLDRVLDWIGVVN